MLLVDLLDGPNFTTSHPDMCELCYKLIYRLCADALTAPPTMSFLRSTGKSQLALFLLLLLLIIYYYCLLLLLLLFIIIIIIISYLFIIIVNIIIIIIIIIIILDCRANV